jgi:hypothetical protein
MNNLNKTRRCEKMGFKITYNGKKKKKIHVKMKMGDMNIQGQWCSYIGDVYIPDGKNRLTDVVNTPNGKFLVLTNVRVLENENVRMVPFLLLNKDSIFSVEELGDEGHGEENDRSLHGLRRPLFPNSPDSPSWVSSH